MFCGIKYIVPEAMHTGMRTIAKFAEERGIDTFAIPVLDRSGANAPQVPKDYAFDPADIVRAAEAELPLDKVIVELRQESPWTRPEPWGKPPKKEMLIPMQSEAKKETEQAFEPIPWTH